MADINYTITFFSDWHCGSGLSGGSGSDALVKKTRGGLPYVPGKTIKGLLKDAARDLFEDDPEYPEFIESCFGNKSENDLESPTYTFHYSKSLLTKTLADYYKQHPIKKENLYRNIQSTRIEKTTGIAKNKFLRTMEVTIPLTLAGRISNIPDDHLGKIKDCMKMIKRLGVKRNRGLGRCRFEILDEKKGGLQ